MATALDRKYTSKDSANDILGAIQRLADDDNHRLLLTDEIEWLERKLAEISRLAKIAKRKVNKSGEW